MFKKSSLTFILLFISFLTIYPSKRENTRLFDYCYPFEKILFRNSLEKSKNVSEKIKNLTKDFTLFGTKKTKGDLANKIIERYKDSKKLFLISFVPNQFYCLTGYWIEALNPGRLSSIFYAKSKQKIKQYDLSKSKCIYERSKFRI